MKLSEMMSSPDVGRPEDTFSLCLSPKLSAELTAADSELFRLSEELEALRSRANVKPSEMRKAVDAAAEAAARADAVRARMEDHSVLLHLRAVDPEKWDEWATEHPARELENNPSGYRDDAKYTGLSCNTADLIVAAGDFITAYGDEQPNPNSWEFARSNAARGDLNQLASRIARLHIQVVDAGKSRSAWLAALSSGADSK